MKYGHIIQTSMVRTHCSLLLCVVWSAAIFPKNSLPKDCPNISRTRLTNQNANQTINKACRVFVSGVCRSNFFENKTSIAFVLVIKGHMLKVIHVEFHKSKRWGQRQRGWKGRHKDVEDLEITWSLEENWKIESSDVKKDVLCWDKNMGKWRGPMIWWNAARLNLMFRVFMIQECRWEYEIFLLKINDTTSKGNAF